MTASRCDAGYATGSAAISISKQRLPRVVFRNFRCGNCMNCANNHGVAKFWDGQCSVREASLMSFAHVHRLWQQHSSMHFADHEVIILERQMTSLLLEVFDES